MRKDQSQTISLPSCQESTYLSVSNYSRETASEDQKVIVNQPRVSPCHKNCLNQIEEQKFEFNDDDKQLHKHKIQMTQSLNSIQNQNKMMQNLSKSIKQTLSHDDNSFIHQKNKHQINKVSHHSKLRPNSQSINIEQNLFKIFDKNGFSQYYHKYHIEYI